MICGDLELELWKYVVRK